MHLTIISAKYLYEDDSLKIIWSEELPTCFCSNLHGLVWRLHPQETVEKTTYSPHTI